MKLLKVLILMIITCSVIGQENDFVKRLQSYKYIRESHQNFMAGEYSKAIESSQSGLEVDYQGHRFALNSLLGFSNSNLRNFTTALTHLQEAKKYEHDGTIQERTDLYWGIGDCYVELGDLKEGIKNYEKALGLSPSSEEIRVNLGKYLVLDNQPTKALEYLEELLTNGTKYESMVRLDRAFCFIQLEKYEEAKKDLDLCQKLDPLNPFLYIKLADYYYYKLNSESLCDAINTALDLLTSDNSLLEDRQIMKERKQKYCSD